MHQAIGCVSLLVREYDEAIEFFTGSLGFRVVENTRLEEDRRWVLVAPRGGHGVTLLLAKATGADQLSRVGNQTGGRVFLFLHTDDFWRDYRVMRSRGIEFVEEPRNEDYGTVAVFRDLYGNRWDLVERAAIVAEPD